MLSLLKCLLPRSFSAQCSYAIVLGALVGFAFGPRVVFLKPLGDILSRVTVLLVLPYLVFEIAGLFGSLGTPALRALVRGGGLLFGFGLLVAGVEITLLPLILPDISYSPPLDPRLLDAPVQRSLLDSFLPENIVEALANGNFTAVVLFSAALGLTVQRMDGKEEILAVLLPLRRLFTEFFILALDILTPVGILGIVAVTIGTQDPADTLKIAGLFVMLGVTLLANTLALFPGLYLAATPYSLRTLVRILRDPVIVGMTTGNIILALPMVCRNLEQFIHETSEGDDEQQRIDGLMAITSMGLLIFSLGEHLNLLFLPFAAWFKGAPLSVQQTLDLLVTSLPASLGAPGAAISEGLEKISLSGEMLNLYFLVSEWMMRIGCVETLVATTSGVLLLLAADRGRLRWRIPRVVGTVTISIGIGLGAGFLGHRLMLPLVGRAGTSAHLLRERPSLLSKLRPIVLEAPPEERVVGGATQPDGRILRAGIVTNNPPWVFRGKDGEWVGFEIDLLKSICRVIDSKLELLPGSLSNLETLLVSNRIDCVVGGIAEGADLKTHSHNRIFYGEYPLAVLVRDSDLRDRIGRLDKQSDEEVRIAVVRFNEDRAAQWTARNYLTHPDTRLRIRWLPIDSVMEFIEAKSPTADALLTTAEAGISLAILHTDHTMLPVFGSGIRQRMIILISDSFPGGVAAAENFMGQITALGVQRKLWDYWFRLRDPEEKSETH